jgi:hypothetical protein
MDRKVEIEKRNQELYAKMSTIFKNGAGNVAPIRKSTGNSLINGFE